MNIRDRVVELRRVKASELVPHDRNWRRHPAAQRTALSAVLAEIGFTGALIARALPDGRLALLDGHLRADVASDEVLPVLVVDLDADEADKLLATFDPIGEMAERDSKLLTELLAGIEAQGDDFARLVRQMGEKLSPPEVEDPPLPDAGLQVVKPGELWALGRHRMICGDSLDPEIAARVTGGGVLPDGVH